MCLFRAPKPPAMPERPETPPKPEPTAKAPTLGKQRESARPTLGMQRKSTTTKTKRERGTQTTDTTSGLSTSSPRRSLSARRRGTSSLRIPLASSGDLRY